MEKKPKNWENIAHNERQMKNAYRRERDQARKELTQLKETCGHLEAALGQALKQVMECKIARDRHEQLEREIAQLKRYINSMHDAAPTVADYVNAKKNGKGYSRPHKAITLRSKV